MDTENVTPAASHRPHAPLNALLLLGSAFIVIAIFVLVSSSWGAFNPAGRIVTAALPLVALYAIAYANRHNEHQQNLVRYTTLTGSLIFPLVVGVIIYQSHLYDVLDSLFYFLVALISLIWYLYLEFSLGKSNHALLTIAAAVSLAYSFAGVLEAEPYVYLLLYIALGGFFLNVGLTADRQNQAWQARVYTYAGTFFGWIGLMLAPGSFRDDVFDLVSALLYVLVAAIFFGLAVVYSRDWQARGSSYSLVLRRVCEFSSAVTLTIPAMLASWGYPEDTALAVLTIALGILSVAISTHVRVRLFRILGWIASVSGFITLLFVAYSKLAAAWPITLLVLGFLLIGIAYLFQRGDYHARMQKWFATPEHSLFGLGVQPEHPEKEAAAKHGSAFMLIIGALIVIYFLMLIA